MNLTKPIVFVISFGLIVVICLILAGPLIMDTAASALVDTPESQCFPGVTQIVELIPVLYYGFVAVLTASGAWIGIKLWRDPEL